MKPTTCIPDTAGSRGAKLAAGILVSCTILAVGQTAAEAASVSGNSLTIVRMRESAQDDFVMPLYEYLNISATDATETGAMSAHLGGWGRLDLAERSTEERTEGDIQYGYLSYRSNRSNLQANAGRQFVVEGIAAERLDGLYLRSDLVAGFTAATWVGTPVTTEPNFQGGELIYGGRVAHSIPRYYSIGLSALRNETDADGLREEEGIDLWLRPLAMVDITGRSSYNSKSNGWMEHAYTVSVIPTDAFRVNINFQKVDYDDYFYHVTTSALSLTNGILLPGEEMWNVGGSVGYTGAKNLSLSAEYNHFEYDIAGHADYYGLAGSYTFPTALTAGGSVHRMDGSTGALSYSQIRLWATQKFGAADVTLDFFDVDFDNGLFGRENTYSLAAAAGYNVNPALRVTADVDYLRSTDFDHELRGLIKVSYAFGFGKEGQP